MSTAQIPRNLYPDCDGQPMAENTLQYEWIVTIKGGIDAQFRDDPNVFVAGDLLWYAVEGHPELRCAPDTLVVFGRPKGYRGSYMQWAERDIAPQVVFEVLSPGNRAAEMQRKFEFYQKHGVEEYYLYDPEGARLDGWLRDGEVLREIHHMDGWTSPRLGVRFTITGDNLKLIHPDGRPFLTFTELFQQTEELEKKTDEQAKEIKLAEWERDRAAKQRDLAAEQRDLAAEQRDLAAKQRDQAQREKSAADAAAEKLREQLRALGVNPQS